MKKNRKLLAALALCLGISCVGAFSACGGKNDNSKDVSSSVVEGNATLALNITEKEMLYGEVLALVPQYKRQEGATLAWSTSNVAVATVNDGTVEAVGEGVATITVTYGDLSAICTVSVVLGDLQPVLHLAHVPNDTLTLGKGSNYTLDAFVAFNNRNYPCDITVDIENPEIVSYENGELKATKSGETTVNIQGVWNNVSGALMQKTIKVKVFSDVVITTQVTVDEETSVADAVDLYIVSEWQGNRYANTADLHVSVFEGAETKSATVEVIEGVSFIEYQEGAITALKEGKSVLRASYINEENESFSALFTINVRCPVVEYASTLELCTGDTFPMATLFGVDAKYTSAKQGEAQLTIADGKLVGIQANGANTEAFEIHTDKGGYLFVDAFVYDKAITAENFAATFTLQYTQTEAIKGYYVLNDDVALEGYQQTTVGNCAARSFAGTFDGRGHKLSATVGPNGLFGAFGHGAIVKDTHFEFTFPDTGEACGLAKNADGFNDINKVVTLENLYVTTTNYTSTSYTLMYMKMATTIIKDVYVNITGVGEYTSAASNWAALFYYDANFNNGYKGQFEGEFRNIHVVTGNFIPMANGVTPWNTVNRFVTFARNDLSKLGKVKQNSSSQETVYYCFLNNQNTPGSVEDGYFGTVNYLYAAKSSILNGGIARYDTVSELKATGIAKIGSWDVK